MYLLDTDVISALAPTKRLKTPSLASWMEQRAETIFLSAVTIAEITDGIAQLIRRGSERKGEQLEAWLETLLHLYGPHILPIDAAVARTAGRLSDRSRSLGHDPGFADVLIAATAEHHRLVILSRNLRHFSPLGAHVVDPFVTLPD